MNLMESLMAQGISASSGGSNLTPEVKSALLDCFANVAWATEDGQQYYDALADALYGLQSISAVYTQSGTVYDTDSLDSLKADLVVTATYGDGTTQTVPAESYTLSGTLTEGTSTITVSYGGKSATFDVTVTARVLFEWKPSDGLDSLSISQSSGTPSYTLRSDALRINLVQSMSNTTLISITQIFQIPDKYKVSVEYGNLLNSKNAQLAVTARFDSNNNARVVLKSINQVVSIAGVEFNTTIPENGKLSMVYDKGQQTIYAYIDAVFVASGQFDGGTSPNTAVVWANTTNLDYIDIKHISIERV